MLTGLEKPTSGKATALGVIDEKDVELFEDYGDLVDFIGICPQEDVLIDRMTVRENLEFFCRFKGVERHDLIIDEILDEYNL
jgi:ATP-binding cassette subfamily A (ABC1) protein 3